MHLGDSELQETDNYTHLGIVCNKYMNMKENVQESASKIRKIFFGLLNSAFCETELHPLTLKRIYDFVVLPKALYGCELWCDIRQSDILALERSHRLCPGNRQEHENVRGPEPYWCCSFAI